MPPISDTGFENIMTSPLTQLNKHLQQLKYRGKQFLEQGELVNATSTYRQILEIKPNDIDSLYLLGLIADQQNQTKDANILLAKALDLSPDNPHILIALGNLYTKVGDYEKAVDSYEKLLKINSSNYGVYCYLAKNYSLLNDHNQAIKTLNNGLTVHPHEEVLYLLLEGQYNQISDSASANAILKKCYQQGFRSENLFRALALSYRTIGNIDEAKRYYQEAYETYPNQPYFLYHLSRFAPEVINSDLYEKLNDEYNTNTLSQESRAFYQYVMAQYLRINGDFTSEMRLLINGHRDFREASRFVLDTNFFLSKLPKFAKDRKKQILKSSSTSNTKAINAIKPIFFVGVPRSGSTLIESVLSANDKITKSMEECGFILDAHLISCLEQRKSYSKTFYAFVQDFLKKHELLDNGCYFTDKSLENIYFIDIILKVFPNAKIIWTKRQPLASIVSILQNNLVNLSWAHDLNDILEYFKATLDIIDYWKNKYPDQIYTINYEQFVSNPIEESQALYKFCELHWNEDCLKKYKHKPSNTASSVQIRKQIHTGATKVFENYVPVFEEYFEQHPWLKG